jgi:hypothetical protein
MYEADRPRYIQEMKAYDDDERENVDKDENENVVKGRCDRSSLLRLMQIVPLLAWSNLLTPSILAIRNNNRKAPS